MSKKFHFYKQFDAMDCGAVCLRMIARHYNRFYSLEYLRDITFFDKEGVSLTNISDAAEKIGFHTLGAKVSFQQLLEDLPLPAILHWKQQHFVVLYKISEKYAWIADPAIGKVKLEVADFLKAWGSDVVEGETQGVVLLLETTPEFFEREGEKKKRTSVTYLFEYFNKQKRYFLQVFIGLIIISLIQFALPFLIAILVDDGIGQADISLIYLILIAQFALFSFQMVFEFFRNIILVHIGVRANMKLVSDYLVKLMRFPIRFFDVRMTGDLLQRVYDNERVERFLSSASLASFFSLFNFIVFGAVLAYFDWTIFAIFVAATIIYVGWILFFLKKRRILDYRRFEGSAKSQSALVELLNGMQEIKLHNAETTKRWGWERIQAQLFRVSKDYLKIDRWQKTGAKFINEIKNIIITVLAAKAVVDGILTLGEMLAIQFILGQLNSPIDQLVEFIRNGQDAKISLDRMNEVHSRPEENQEGKITILPEHVDMMLDQVSFQYRGENSPLVLNDINVYIPQGKTTAIVGTSGSGKTTLLKLLLNIYQPTQGKITVGELNLTNINDRLWRSKCGVVMQDGYIFSESIAKNIALGDEIIDEAKLLNAVKVARIQSVIDGMPLGYNTQIGPMGIGLSRGQSQRILIARAVYKNPDFIFFDEATNALDAYNEMIIMDNLEEVFYKKTVIIVAHRLSTVKNADNIIVLEKGEVVEQGTHEQLTANKATYYYLVKNQLELGA